MIKPSAMIQALTAKCCGCEARSARVAVPRVDALIPELLKSVGLGFMLLLGGCAAASCSRLALLVVVRRRRQVRGDHRCATLREPPSLRR